MRWFGVRQLEIHGFYQHTEKGWRLRHGALEMQSSGSALGAAAQTKEANAKSHC